MFSWKAPSKPKLASVELPTSPDPRTHSHFTYDYPQKPSKPSSFFGRLRSSTERTSHRQDLSADAGRSRSRTVPVARRHGEDDNVVYQPQQSVHRSTSLMARTNIAIVKSKAAKEIEMEREEEERLEELRRIAKKNGHTVSIVPSKAAMEIEQEKREAREKFEELQRQHPLMNPEPRPLKSCLKGASPPKSRLPTPASHDFVRSSHTDGLKRRESSAHSAYYSDTEQYRTQHHKPSTRRTHTYPQQPIAPYPSDPRHLQRHSQDYYRQRNQSFSDPRQVSATTTPINKSNYIKACYKEVPMKDEAIALSWQLVDYETRKHASYPALFFDAAFDPRLVGFEVRVMRCGEHRLTGIARDEETQLVSPHAFMTEMHIVNETLAQWPVVVRNPHGVRCVDVFRAIYDTYAVPLTPAEIMEWGPEYIDRCQRAFDQRCNDGPKLPPVTKSKGICRVDLLRGERIFKGLTPQQGGRWQLHFEKITRRSNR